MLGLLQKTHGFFKRSGACAFGVGALAPLRSLSLQFVHGWLPQREDALSTGASSPMHASASSLLRSSERRTCAGAQGAAAPAPIVANRLDAASRWLPGWTPQQSGLPLAALSAAAACSRAPPPDNATAASGRAAAGGARAGNLTGHIAVVPGGALPINCSYADVVACVPAVEHGRVPVHCMLTHSVRDARMPQAAAAQQHRHVRVAGLRSTAHIGQLPGRLVSTRLPLLSVRARRAGPCRRRAARGCWWARRLTRPWCRWTARAPSATATSPSLPP